MNGPTAAAHARIVVLAFASIALCACPSRKREDAHGIVSAYQSFQEASATDRPTALAALEKARCDDPPTCADRDACRDYASKLMRANDLAARAKALTPEDAGGSGAATPAELSIIIAGADDAVKAAEQAEPKCRAALSRLSSLGR